MDPFIKQCADDRGYFIKLEKQLLNQNRQVEALENIVFQKEELESLDLFGKIFKQIQKVDNSRTVEEESLKVHQNELRIDLERLNGANDTTQRRLDLQQEQVMDLNKQLKDQMQLNIQFQQDFLGKYQESQSNIMEEFNTLRQRATDGENTFAVHLHQIQTLQYQEKLSTQTLEHQDKWLQQLQELVNGLKYQKLDKEEFTLRSEDINLEQEVLKETSELHENHFSMVENFTEKYIPIRIQSQISETLRALLSSNMTDKLDDYEETAMQEMHQRILDDDGVPTLIEDMRAMKF